jgi:hypothetical protein
MLLPGRSCGERDLMNKHNRHRSATIGVPAATFSVFTFRPLERTPRRLVSAVRLRSPVTCISMAIPPVPPNLSGAEFTGRDNHSNDLTPRWVRRVQPSIREANP